MGLLLSLFVSRIGKIVHILVRVNFQLTSNKVEIFYILYLFYYEFRYHNTEYNFG